MPVGLNSLKLAHSFVTLVKLQLLRTVMFLSENQQSKSSSTKPEWTLNDNGLTNNFTEITYEISKLSFSLEKDGYKRLKQIVELNQQGLMNRHIANQLNINDGIVTHNLRRAGIEKNKTNRPS